jgi:thiamine-phosphate pyrophosphorylase
MKALPECRLYAFVDADYLGGRRPEDMARQLCDGGADIIQLRAKRYSADEMRKLAETVLPVARRAGVGVVINDHLAVAQAIGADFCHLGQEDFFGAGRTHVRQLFENSPPVGIGLSTHRPEEAARALAARPDYIAIGPVYATATKPDARPVTLEYVRWAAAHVTIPWFAIGGITLANLDDVLAAGARAICVVSAILRQDDIEGACREFRRRLSD